MEALTNRTDTLEPNKGLEPTTIPGLHLARQALASPGIGSSGTLGEERDTMTKLFHTLFITALLMQSTIFSGEKHERRISVSGSAVEEVVPDTFEFSVTVEFVRPTLEAAVKQHHETVSKILTNLKTNDVPEKDMQTSRQTFRKHYKRVRADGGWQSIHDGFEATSTLRVTLRDLSKYSPIVKYVVKQDGCSIGYSSFSFSGRKGLEEKLLKKAFLNAKSRATTLVSANNDKLGDLISVRMGYYADDYGGDDDDDDSGTYTVSPGMISISMSVRVVFEIQ